MRPTNQDIAKQWRELIELKVVWHDAASHIFMRTGRCRGKPCSYEGFDRVAYVKPTTSETANQYAAAREKVAADLAFDLNINVPPAVLAPKVRDVSAEVACVASLVMRDMQMNWRLACVSGPAGKDLIQAIPNRDVAGTRLLVFNTWLCQHDHQDDDPQGNLVIGYGLDDTDAYTDVELVALDYEGALAVDKKVARRPGSFPHQFAQSLQKVALEEAIAAIENYSTEALRQIMLRIPERYVPVDVRDEMLDALLQRRDTLGAAFPELREQS